MERFPHINAQLLVFSYTQLIDRLRLALVLLEQVPSHQNPTCRESASLHESKAGLLRIRTLSFNLLFLPVALLELRLY